MISLVKKDYDSTKIYRKTHKKGASQTYDTPSSLWERKFFFRSNSPIDPSASRGLFRLPL